MKTETEESICSSVKHENGDGSMSRCSTEAEMEGVDRSFLFHRLFCFCRAYVTNFKCEPLLMEVQVEMEGAGVNQALGIEHIWQALVQRGYIK